MTAQGSPVTGSITIGPYSALILSQTPPSRRSSPSGQTNGVLTVSWPNTYGWWVLDSSPALMGNPAPWVQVPSTQYQTNAAAVFINPVASAGFRLLSSAQHQAVKGLRKYSVAEDAAFGYGQDKAGQADD